MIRHPFGRGVVLRLGSREIRAADARALRASLSGQAAVTSARMAELSTMSDRALGAHADALDNLIARVAGSLSQPDADPAPVLAGVGTQEPAVERAWAEALASAREWDAGYQRALLEALVEHLAGERDCVRTLLANRRRPAPRGHDDLADIGRAVRQRLILDPAVLAGAREPTMDFERMTKGSPLEVAMSPGQALEIMLAQHRFLIVAGTPWLLVDEYGEDLRLKNGRNLVGRSPECDAVVHEHLRAVSRRHAVLETDAHGAVRITDISSLGTFLPRACMDSRVH